MKNTNIDNIIKDIKNDLKDIESDLKDIENKLKEWEKCLGKDFLEENLNNLNRFIEKNLHRLNRFQDDVWFESMFLELEVKYYLENKELIDGSEE